MGEKGRKRGGEREFERERAREHTAGTIYIQSNDQWPLQDR